MQNSLILQSFEHHGMRCTSPISSSLSHVAGFQVKPRWQLQLAQTLLQAVSHKAWGLGFSLGLRVVVVVGWFVGWDSRFSCE